MCQEPFVTGDHTVTGVQLLYSPRRISAWRFLMLLLNLQHWSSWDTCKNQAVTRELLRCKSLPGGEIPWKSHWAKHARDTLWKSRLLWPQTQE